MSGDITAALTALVAKWRAEADHSDACGGHWHTSCLTRCFADELESALTGPLAQGWVMVPTKLTDAIREAGRIDDADWMCIIAAALAATPPTAAKENEK